MMKRIFVLFISVLTLVPTFAQTQEEIEGWSQKGFANPAPANACH